MLESVELIILLLISSVIFLTVFRYLKLSATIAYFAIGILLGPSAAGLLHDSESVRHFVEFGIVFLMFSIGLEFSLPKLNSMRGILFGLGGAQVLITLAASLIIWIRFYYGFCCWVCFDDVLNRNCFKTFD